MKLPTGKALTFRRTSPSCELDGSCGDISRLWGQYSSFFSVPSEIDASTPGNCQVTFALALSRHGARYPTTSKSEAYNATIARIQKRVSKYGEGHEWLKDYVYELGSEDLTEFGEKQMVDSGRAFYQRYIQLAEKSEPFVRASGSDRVIVSSYNFTQGFYASRGESADAYVGDVLIISEASDSNNTMSHGSCASFEGDGNPQKHKHREVWDRWGDIFLQPITTRLNKNLRGVKLTKEEVVFMMDMCPFDSANTPDGIGKSMFCDLFTPEEWRDYDYFLTLSKYYKYGNGHPMGPTQGVGYVNELIARLTHKPVVDHTTTNSTLDSSPETFPLDRSLYADFSHDNSMVAIFSALGLYNETGLLPTTRIVPASEAHGYSSAWVVPFAARMYVEKLECGADKEEYVRVLINDRVMGLETCKGDEYGRCKLKDFVQSLSFARAGGHWGKCSSRSR